MCISAVIIVWFPKVVFKCLYEKIKYNQRVVDLYILYENEVSK